MTTITTADLRRSFPRRIRRNAIVALAAAALYMPTAFIVGQINNDNPNRTAAPITNTALDACGGEFGWWCAYANPANVESAGTTSTAATTEPCGGEFGWVCAYANHDEVESVGTTSTAAATTEPCGVGLGWWCAFTPQQGQE